MTYGSGVAEIEENNPWWWISSHSVSEWCILSGNIFSENFPIKMKRKDWTCGVNNLIFEDRTKWKELVLGLTNW